MTQFCNLAPTVKFQVTKMNGGGDISPLEEATRSSRITRNTENVYVYSSGYQRVKLLKTAGIDLHLDFEIKTHRQLRTKGICLF